MADTTDFETFEETAVIQTTNAEAPAAPLPEIPYIKLFGRWSCEDVQISDMSLQVKTAKFWA